MKNIADMTKEEMKKELEFIKYFINSVSKDQMIAKMNEVGLKSAFARLEELNEALENK